MLKDRIVFFKDLKKETSYFFQTPTGYDEQVATSKWNVETELAATEWRNVLAVETDFTAAHIKHVLNELLEAKGIKIGKVMQALRLAITGVGQGPDLMQIIEIIGKEETLKRLDLAVEKLKVV